MSKEEDIPPVVWKHHDPKSTDIDSLRRYINATRGKDLRTYEQMHNYSVTELANFYEDLWHHSGMIYDGTYTTVVDETAPIDSVPDWFPGVRMNFAEMCLFTRGHLSTSHTTKHNKEDCKIALTCLREGGTELSHITWSQLRQRVGQFSQALRAHGVNPSDRIGAVISNSVEGLVAFLGTVAIGAVFSSSATDMGTQGVLDRMAQIEPKWIFMDDVAVYNGKRTDLRPKMKEIVEGMAREVPLFRGIVSLPRFLDKPADVGGVPNAQTLERFLSKASSDELVFERMPFRHPFYIAYSSGTTGKPKCIVHCGGGAALTARKEQKYQHRADSSSTYFQYTTTGWIMYFVQTSCLLSGTRIVLYDGSPFYPTPHEFINVMGTQHITHLGTSPRYMADLQRRNIAPRALTDLSTLRVVTSTGMVLPQALYEWFYKVGFPPNVQLSNITGGTDLMGAIAIGNPLDPVYAGPCQNMALGIAGAVFTQPDPSSSRTIGIPAPRGTPGELVITRPFPSMPVMFYGKHGAQQYYESYFAKFANAWAQGDYAVLPAAYPGLLMLGRTDGVLNPSGVRFGSSELYSVIETHFSHVIVESLAIGQLRENIDADEHVVLFLVLSPKQTFSRVLVESVKQRIAQALSKRHVPRYVFEVPELPTTANGKKIEVPVKKILGGEDVVPSATIANPGCLDVFYAFREVEERWREVEATWDSEERMKARGMAKL